MLERLRKWLANPGGEQEVRMLKINEAYIHALQYHSPYIDLSNEMLVMQKSGVEHRIELEIAIKNGLVKVGGKR